MLILPGRETFLIPVRWEDDWPICNDGERIPLRGVANGLYEMPDTTPWRDDFTNSSNMQLGWYRKSTPQKVDWSLTERPGWLRLWGGPYNLDSPACSTMWLRKQMTRSTIFETKMDFRPDSTGIEAGVVVWWNYTCHSSIGIRLVNSDQGKARWIKVMLADGNTIFRSLKSLGNEVVLVIGGGSEYTFGYREMGMDTQVEIIGTVSNAIMTRDPDIGAAFTGMMLGLYAFGELEAALVPADFSYVRII
jgi:beta-xylosidase